MATATPLPNPALSRALLGDYEALHAHVHQANALAADFQQTGAGKSNELAVLQQVFERAQQDLSKLHASIARLRQERHQLANEAMRAMALERKLAEVTLERDRLRAEGNAMRDGLIASSEATAKRKRETDAQIARMTMELESLRQRGLGPERTSSVGGDADVAAALAQISATLERLTDHLLPGDRPPSRIDRADRTERPAPMSAQREPEPTIDIQFDA